MNIVLTIAFVLACWTLCFIASYLLFGPQLAILYGSLMSIIWQAGTVALTVDS
jgi:hypothetical protein